MREFISYSVALLMYGLGIAVLQVPNPKRIIASRILFALGAIVAVGASSMWLESVSERLWVRALLSILVCGVIGWATVEVIRFAGHTEPLIVSPASSPGTSLPSHSPEPAPEIEPKAAVTATPEISTTKTPKTEPRPRQLPPDQNLKQPSAINQTISNSPGAILAGRDVNVGEKPSPSATEKDRKP